MPEPDPLCGPCLGDLGEWDLIDRLGAFAPPQQFSDDAALLPCEGTVVVNTDVLVEGVHFSDVTTGAFDVGWRAAAANLSDLAAMGCTQAQGLTVGLVAPAWTTWSWVEGVYAGLKACLDQHGGVVLGGDCSNGQQRLLAITALGQLPRICSDGRSNAIRRCDGRPGDLLVCTGSHGLSRLGLALLQGSLSRNAAADLTVELSDRAIRHHRQPSPRFDAVRALQASRPQTCPWRVAGTDSSDGLAAATAAIARASGCRALLNRHSLPLDPGMATLNEAEDWCLNGGEDFELVLALEPSWARAFVAQLPGSRWIGRLAAPTCREGPLGWADGSELLGTHGYQHFGRERTNTEAPRFGNSNAAPRNPMQ